MTDQVFCYHCRRYHPMDEVKRVQSSRGIKRWRCKKSIDSTLSSRTQRDAFGASVSEMNQVKYTRSVPHCVAELFGLATANRMESL